MMKKCYNKTIFVIALLLTSHFVVTGQGKDLNRPDALASSNFTLFEKEFSKTLSTEKEVIKLIGFREMPIAENQIDEFKKLVAEHGDELKKRNTVYAPDYSCFRVYFPFHTAIVEYEGKTYTANEHGVVSIPGFEDISKVTVIGRKRSETVHGTGSNIIEEDRILLKTPLQQITKNGVKIGYALDANTCVFDVNSGELDRGHE
jgi:hypothetical protein